MEAPKPVWSTVGHKEVFLVGLWRAIDVHTFRHVRVASIEL